MLLRPMTTPARAPIGATESGVSCNTLPRRDAGRLGSHGRSAGQHRVVRRRRVRRQRPAVDQLRATRPRLLERPQRLAVVADRRRRREPRLGQRQPPARRVAHRRRVRASTRRCSPTIRCRASSTRSRRSRRGSTPTARASSTANNACPPECHTTLRPVLAAVPARGRGRASSSSASSRVRAGACRRSDPAAVQRRVGLHAARRSAARDAHLRQLREGDRGVRVHADLEELAVRQVGRRRLPDAARWRRRPSAVRGCSSARRRAPSATPARCSPTTSSTRSACRSSARTCRRPPTVPPDGWCDCVSDDIDAAAELPADRRARRPAQAAGEPVPPRLGVERRRGVPPPLHAAHRSELRRRASRRVRRPRQVLQRSRSTDD